MWPLTRAINEFTSIYHTAVDLSYMNLANTKPGDAEVFCPVAAPSGYITATVERV